MHMQVVHFVRHGEGFHNIGIVNEDAHLTEAGWRQADALKKHIAGLTPALDIQASTPTLANPLLFSAPCSCNTQHGCRGPWSPVTCTAVCGG